MTEIMSEHVKPPDTQAFVWYTLLITPKFLGLVVQEQEVVFERGKSPHMGTVGVFYCITQLLKLFVSLHLHFPFARTIIISTVGIVRTCILVLVTFVLALI